MSNNRPRVSIGLPVYNAASFLAETLDSLLAQTFTDFELVISDNASTDGTEDICRAYAARDPRIRYSRNRENLGGSANYNRVFHLSSGEYFKWAAADDLVAKEYVERCVEVLARDPSVVLCYARAKAIDERGNIIKVYPAASYASASRPQDRFHEFVCVPHPFIAVFGVMRASVLGRTRLIGKYASSDRPLLSELSLLGRFYEIPEYLFFYRHHPQQSWRAYSTRGEVQAWYDPARVRKVTFRHWRLFWEHLRSVGRAPLTWSERASCFLYMGWWVRKRWRRLARDLVLRDTFPRRGVS